MAPQLPNELVKIITQEVMKSMKWQDSKTLLRTTRNLAATNKAFATFVNDDLGPAACDVINDERWEFHRCLRYPLTVPTRLALLFRRGLRDTHNAANELMKLKNTLNRLVGGNPADEMYNFYCRKKGWRREQKRMLRNAAKATTVNAP